MAEQFRAYVPALSSLIVILADAAQRSWRDDRRICAARPAWDCPAAERAASTAQEVLVALRERPTTLACTTTAAPLQVAEEPEPVGETIPWWLGLALHIGGWAAGGLAGVSCRCSRRQRVRVARPPASRF